jgi:hypothetical protein
LAFVGGLGGLIRYAAVYLMIAIPISTVIFFIAMILSNLIAGAGEIGEIHKTVFKAFVLVTIANIVTLVPFGRWLVFLIWVGGAITLFRLDIWEAKIIILFNWGLNFLMRWVLLMILITGASSGSGTSSSRDTEPPPDRARPAQNNQGFDNGGQDDGGFDRDQ